MTTHLPVHPRTGLRALGVLPSGRIVWPAMGGDGNGDGSGGTGDGGQSGGDGGQSSQQQGQGGQQQGGQTPPAQQPQQGQTNDGGQQGGDGGDDLASMSQADLAKMVKDLRRENASARTNAKTTAAEEARQEFAQKIGKALGLVDDSGGDKGPDPDQLAEQLSGERRERYAEKAARAAGLDGDALLDSRAFATKLGKLDPAASDFSTSLDALVREYKDDPKYQTHSTGQAPARSGGNFSGGPGDQGATFTREQIARMSASEYAQNREAIMAQLGKSK